MFLHSSSLTVN